jgi:hypothetical protein
MHNNLINEFNSEDGVYDYNKISISKFYRAMEILNVKKHGRAVPSFLKKTYEMLEVEVLLFSNLRMIAL